MSAATLAALEAFRSDWSERLNRSVRFELHCGARSDGALAGVGAADRFVQSRGFGSIGFNWELLDSEAGPGGTRSACGAMVEALTHRLGDPGRPWLDPANARRCARQFLDAFAPASPTVFTNHLNGLWWPISGAADEWSFVAMDDDVIALWLMAG